MSKRLFARGSDGLVAIVEGGNDAYINDPINNLSNVLFHSNFNYMRIVGVYTGTVNFPYRANATQTSGGGKKGTSTYDIPASGSDIYSIGTHNLLYVPGAIAFMGTMQITPTYPLQTSGASMRMISAKIDSYSVSIYEQWFTYGNALGAVSKDFTIYVFQNPI